MAPTNLHPAIPMRYSMLWALRIKHALIEGANHYYFGQPELLARSVQECMTWLTAKGFT